MKVTGVSCPATQAFGFERVTDGVGCGFECDRRFSGATGAFEEVAAGCEQSGVAGVVGESI